MIVLFVVLQPPNCSAGRPRRQAGKDPSASSSDAVGSSEVGSDEGTPATIEVYSGLYVNEANDLAKAAADDDDSVYSEKVITHRDIPLTVALIYIQNLFFNYNPQLKSHYTCLPTYFQNVNQKIKFYIISL